MNDGIDTMRDNNALARSRTSERDVQQGYFKKVHSVFLKARSREFTGCVAPLGIGKTEDKTLMVARTALVRQIFLGAGGRRPQLHPARLEERRVPCPTWWNRERGFRNVRTKWDKERPGKRAVYGESRG